MLDLNHVLAAIAQRCITPLGQTRARRLCALGSAEAACNQSRLGKEAFALLHTGDPLPMRECADVTGLLDRLGANAALNRVELRDLQRVLALGRTLRRFFAARKERTLLLARALSTNPLLDPIEDQIREAFDSDGLIRDDASPALGALRERARSLRARILGRLDTIMKEYAHTIQEEFITEREGRHVLPVRADSHERFPGILHATSASGATLFIEPNAVVQLGNELKVLEGDVEREEARICADLSAHLSAHIESVRAATEMVAEADMLAAIARLAVDHAFAFVEPAPEPELLLKAARNPLLLLNGTNVVPCDITLLPGKVMVVSGPNAGGKTVALKTAGLVAEMLRVGLPLPCSEGSRVGFFSEVHAEIGDGQTLSLSTFSAHVQTVARMLERAKRGSLILIDELAGGTDPREGEVLALALLKAFAARDATVMVTTHYEALRAHAFADDTFRNASVGFNTETWAPTFQILPNVPGPSSALAVARRFGVPADVLASAEALLSDHVLTADTLIRGLHEAHTRLTLALLQAEASTNEANALREKLEHEREQLAARGERQATKEVEALFARAEAMRAQVEALAQKLRNTETGSVRSLEVEADTLVKSMRASRTEDAYPALKAAPQRGTRVFVRASSTAGDVLEAVGSDAVRIQVGAMKMVVKLAELALSKDSQSNRAIKDNTCDVRGLRADDAVNALNHFIDVAVQKNVGTLYVLHGAGAGVVKERLTQTLRKSAYVASFRKGEPHEGGDAVTVALLA
jgi:DNA mismatch repair protein MutS2